MLLGFLFIDILLWAVAPFLILCLLWGDMKGWATVAAIALAAIVVFGIGWTPFVAMVTDPLWISTALRNLAIYAGIGFSFSFLKWWVLANKSAKEFVRFLSGRSFTIDVEKVERDVRSSRSRGGVDHFAGSEEDAIAAAKAETLQQSRVRAASDWNDSYNNTYRKVLSVVAKNPSGWETKYAKFTLTEYVTSWTVYWPFYAVLLVLDDLIRHIIDWFVNVFGKGFQRIANSAFGKID